MALSAHLSGDARDNLQRLVLSGSISTWTFVSSSSPESSPWAWETRMNVSLSEKRRTHKVSQRGTCLKEGHQDGLNTKSGKNPCLKVLARWVGPRAILTPKRNGAEEGMKKIEVVIKVHRSREKLKIAGYFYTRSELASHPHHRQRSVDIKI